MQRSPEVKVGLTVLIAIFLLYLSIAWTQRLHLFAPEEFGYEIQFDNVNGLLEGDPITVRGYTAGRVVSIVPSQYHVAVRIKLDQSISLFQDAQAQIQVKELMGGKQIAIQPGQQSPVLADGSLLQGNISPDFSSSFSQFGDLTAQLNLSQVQAFLQRIDSFTLVLMRLTNQIDPDALSTSLNNAAEISSDMKQFMAEAESRKMLERVDSSLISLQAMLSNGNQMMGQAEATLTRIETGILPEVDTLLSSSAVSLDQVQEVLTQVDQLMTRLESTDNLAGRLFSDPSLSLKVDTTIYHLNKTLEMIHSKRVIVGFQRKK